MLAWSLEFKIQSDQELANESLVSSKNGQIRPGFFLVLVILLCSTSPTPHFSQVFISEPLNNFLVGVIGSQRCSSRVTVCKDQLLGFRARTVHHYLI